MPFWADPAWDLDEDLGLVFGLARAPDAPRRRCRNALIGSLIAAVRNGDSGIFYSRDRNWYPANRHVLPPFVTYRALRWAVDTMEAAAEHFVSRRAARARPRPEEMPRRRSSLHPGPGFLEATRGLKFDQPKPEAQFILLRDRQGRTMRFTTTAETRQVDSLLARYNAMLAHHSITCAPAAETDGGPLRDIRTGPVVAIFNGDFGRGGRLYCGPWMDLPKSERATLLVDGEPVVEVDYSSCHLRLLLAASGEEELARDLSFDPYAIAGFDRRAIKVGILILLNAANAEEAEAALEQKLAESDLVTPHQTAKTVIAAVRRAFPKLAPTWSSGIGIELMNVDANMCLSVIQTLMKDGIVVLSVHDSFIVQARHETALRRAMDTAFEGGLFEAKRRFGSRFSDAGLCGNGLTSRATHPSRPSARLPLSQVMRGRAQRMLAELECLLVQDPRPLDSRVLLAAILLGAIYPLATDLAARVRAVFERYCRACDVAALMERACRIVAEAEARGHFRISNAGAARLAAAPQHIAERLGLDLLMPPRMNELSRKARSNLQRRRKRQGQRKSSRIVNLGRARPWEFERLSRSRWYARHPDPSERQLLGLRALLLRDDAEAVAQVRREITLRVKNSRLRKIKEMQHALDSWGKSLV
jgi:hypothetical protein